MSTIDRRGLCVTTALALAGMLVSAPASLADTGQTSQLHLAALAVSPGVATTGYSVRSDGDDLLYRIDLHSGAATAVGTGVGFGDVEGLAFDAGGTLYGVDDESNTLVTINTTTGTASPVGSLTASVTDVGLDFDCSGALYLSTDAPSPQTLYRVNTATGAAVAVGSTAIPITGLAFDGQQLLGLTGDSDGRLVSISRDTGAVTAIGPTGVSVQDGGLAAARDGTLWGITDAPGGEVYTFDKTTGAATLVAPTGLIGFESLAIDAPSLCNPPTITITSGPNGLTKLSRPTFGFAAAPTGVAVTCRVDGQVSTCTGTGEKRIEFALAEGDHTLEVTAEARDGARATTQRRFTVDTRAPDTKLNKRPANRSPKTTATYTYVANEPGVTFRCRLDRGHFKPCDPFRTTVKGLSSGRHSFRVRAFDAAGNREARPAEDRFVVVR